MTPARPCLPALLRSAMLAGALFPVLSQSAAQAAPAAAAGPLRYTVMVDGDPRAGHQVVRQVGNGETRVSFAYMDQGRDVRLEERFTLAPDGTYLSYTAEGTTRAGERVDASYRRLDGDAGLYLPDAGSPASLGVALAALARQPSGALPLRGGGILRGRVIGGLDLIRRGQRRTVELHALTGIGTVPVLAWATDGAHPRLFAHLDPDGILLIEAGWESVADALERRQHSAVEEEVRELEERLSHRVDGSLLIRGARLFDSERAVMGPPASVLVRDGRIVEVDAAGGALRGAESATQVVEAAGRTLLPGMFDVAARAGGWTAPLQLAAGATTLTPGGPVVAPGDPEGDAPLADRLARAVEAGADPAAVLRAATWDAARSAGMLDASGSISTGKRADLVLLDGDPTADIAALRRTALVLRDGVLFYPAEIRRAFGLPPTTAPVRPAAPPPPRRSRLDSEAREMPAQFPG